MKLKEKIKLIKNWNLNAVPPNNIQLANDFVTTYCKKRLKKK